MSNQRQSLGKDEVFVLQSPVSSIKQRGNLTGNARVLRDHVADMCELIHKWNSDLVEGVAVISEIKRFMFDRIEAQKKNHSDFPHSDQLQSLSANLNQICERMELIVEKLGQKSTCILSIQRLEDKQRKALPMFLTWPVTKFVETSQNIYEMFRKEIELKISIKNELCFCPDKPTLTFYSTAWSQQPYIEKSVNLNFEAMLKEVGHPSIYDKSSSTQIPIKD